jgi:DNA-binding HxlR family transcriptional regulator
MNDVNTSSAKPFFYPNRTLERARRALICSSFNLQLFQATIAQSVPFNAIAGKSGTEKGYTKRSLTELAVDSELSWLIQVGVLRREVDGQGITDSFRLTPLGRQLVERYAQSGTWDTPTWRDRLYNTLNRWLRLPF